MDRTQDVSQLLTRLAAGEEQAGEELYHVLERELRRLAGIQLARQEPGHTLQTTALVNEAWMRLVPGGRAEYDGRDHFLAVAARAMRSVLVDHARRKAAARRGGGAARVELDEALACFEERGAELIALDEALSELGRADERSATIVELRFFGGLSHPEIARVVGISTSSVERGWRSARAWLRTRLGDGGEPPESSAQ